MILNHHRGALLVGHHLSSARSQVGKQRQRVVQFQEANCELDQVIDLSVGRARSAASEPEAAEECPPEATKVVEGQRAGEGGATPSSAKTKKLDAAPKSKRTSRRTRTMFSEWQLGELEWRFQRNKYLITSDRIRMAKLLQLDQLQVKTWFQNRRMKWKKQILASGSCAGSPTKPKGRPRRDSIPPVEDFD